MVTSKKRLGMKRLIIEIIIAVLLSATVVIAKPFCIKRRMSSGNFGVEALVERGKVSHLFIGSSMFRNGMQADDVKNDDMYLIAYDGNQPYLIYKIVSYLLKKGVKIENLYCDMYAYAAVSRPSIFDERIFLDTDLSFQLDVLEEVKTFGRGGFSTYYDALVTSNMEVIATWPISYRLINTRYDRGASLPSDERGQAAEDLLASKVDAAPSNLNERQVYYINELIRLSQKNNINLCFIETPKYRKVTEEFEYPVIMEKYAMLLNGTNMVMDESTYNKIQAGPEIIRYPFDDDNADYFSDLLHLSGIGRGLFSKSLHKLLGIS